VKIRKQRFGGGKWTKEGMHLERTKTKEIYISLPIQEL